MPENAISWLDWLRIANFYLGIKPEEFWSITPLELMAILKPLGDVSAQSAITRSEFNVMRNHFPD